MTGPTSSGRLVVGLQPVREAIRVHGGKLGSVWVDDRPLPRLDAVARFARDSGVEGIRRVPRKELDRLAGSATHQGVVAWAPALELTHWERLTGDTALLAIGLDHIQDPQNFGAVIRSAVALGGATVLWGENASAPLTPATFRASAGAVEHARLCRVPSLRGALQSAALAGVQVVGLDANASSNLHDLDLRGPTVMVLGSEHHGLGHGVRKACTSLARLASQDSIDSLNASVAVGIALYQAWIQRNIPST